MTDLKPAFESWPRWLNQRQAAAYVGVSVGTFAKERRKGIWPAPGRASGRWQLWDRLALDAASNRLSGFSAGAPLDDVGQSRDPGYFKRRLAKVYGDE